MPDVFSLKVAADRRHKAGWQLVARLADRDIYLGKHGSAASRGAYQRIVAEYL